MVLVPPSPRWRRTAGGHGLLEAVPRIYQVTPESPAGDERHNRTEVRPQIWPTASKRVSSPPVGNLPPASDVTDAADHNSKPQRSSPLRRGETLELVDGRRSDRRPKVPQLGRGERGELAQQARSRRPAAGDAAQMTVVIYPDVGEKDVGAKCREPQSGRAGGVGCRGIECESDAGGRNSAQRF